jgi:hypothetical protein
MRPVTDADTPQLAGWATQVIEEVLGEVARHIHERADPAAPIEIAATFQVTVLAGEGLLAVRAPGGRGRTVHVGIAEHAGP